MMLTFFALPFTSTEPLRQLNEHFDFDNVCLFVEFIGKSSNFKPKSKLIIIWQQFAEDAPMEAASVAAMEKEEKKEDRKVFGEGFLCIRLIDRRGPWALSYLFLR